nr:MAG TPA: hypothetical protein [Bacteriophage sp.]
MNLYLACLQTRSRLLIFLLITSLKIMEKLLIETWMLLSNMIWREMEIL